MRSNVLIAVLLCLLGTCSAGLVKAQEDSGHTVWSWSAQVHRPGSDDSVRISGCVASDDRAGAIRFVTTSIRFFTTPEVVVDSLNITEGCSFRSR